MEGWPEGFSTAPGFPSFRFLLKSILNFFFFCGKNTVPGKTDNVQMDKNKELNMPTISMFYEF